MYTSEQTPRTKKENINAINTLTVHRIENGYIFNLPDDTVRSALMVGGMSEEKFLYGLAMSLAVNAIENIEVDRHESTTKR